MGIKKENIPIIALVQNYCKNTIAPFAQIIDQNEKAL
jgi:hypothetical protein